MTYSAQLATRPSDIDAVLRLRHDMYVNHMGLVTPDHPYVQNGRLQDPYDDRSHHLVLRSGTGQVVGTARFTCARDGALEVKEAKRLADYWLPTEELMEITRVMILKPHRCMLASVALFGAVLDATRQLNCRYMLAAGKLGSLGQYYRNMGMEMLDAEPFEYPLIPKMQVPAPARRLWPPRLAQVHAVGRHPTGCRSGHPGGPRPVQHRVPPGLVHATDPRRPGGVIMLERQFYALSLLDRYAWSKPPSQSPRFDRRDQICASVRARDGFVMPRPAAALPETSAHDLDTFVRGTHGYRHPFVIRGYMRETPAVKTWSKEHLTEQLRGVNCKVFVQDQASRTRSWDQGTDLVELPFEAFVDRMATEHLYLNNATEVFLGRPELVDDLQLERIRRDLTTPDSSWDELVTTNLFVGAKHVFSAVHAAPGGNFFLNLVGRKKWTFIDPRYAPHLHALPSRPFQYLKSAYGGSRAQAELGNDEHPLQMLPRFEVTLEPGDLLYNAPWWWHEVDNLDDFTVGCAVRHLVPPLKRSPTVRNNPIYSLASEYPKFHAAALGHWAKQQVFGGDGSLREVASELQVRALRKGLSRGRPSRGRS